MNLLHGLEGLAQLSPGSILSIGNFDGIHRGHQRLLETGRQLRSQTSGARLACVTFEPHPFTVLRPTHAPPRLTPIDLKRQLLAEQGVDDLVELSPEPVVLGLTAEQFWAILRDQCRPNHLVEGSEFTFGKSRGGTIQHLTQWSNEAAIQLHIVPPVQGVLADLRLVDISSTLIRWLLLHGRTREAAMMLGRPYALRGKVITGHQRGRTIGVPTANLDCGTQLVPDDGVYAGQCIVDKNVYPCAISIGTLPTFADSKRQIEAHLIGYDGDLYGRILDVQVVHWLREQWKFDGVDELKRQMERDISQCVERIGEDACRFISV